MKFLLFILFISAAYFGVGAEGLPLEKWQGALLSSVFLIAACGVWLYEPIVGQSKFVAFRRPRLSDWGMMGMGAFLVFSFVFLSFFQGPSLAKGVRESFIADVKWDGTYQDGGADFSNDNSVTPMEHPASGRTRAGASEKPEIRIPLSGKVELPSFPEVRVLPKNEESSQAMKRGPQYVRMKALGHSDGVFRWSMGSADFSHKAANEEGWVTIEQQRKLESLSPVHVQVVHGAHNKYLYALQGVERVKIPELRGSIDTFFALPKENPKRTESGGSWSYEAISYPVNFDDFSGNLLDAMQPAESLPVYRENRFNNKLRNRIAREVRPYRGFDMHVQLGWIRNRLQRECRYSLDIKNAKGLPPLENFLYGEKEGFCLHFATAAALYCRELGIPCRIATGYSSGTHFRNRDMWVFYTKNAHAWLEVKVKDFGRIVFDVTPEEAIPIRTNSGQAPPEEFPSEEERESFWEDLEEKETAKKNEDAIEVMGIFSLFTQDKVLFTALLVVLALLACIGIWQKAERRKSRKEELEEDERVVYEEKKYIAIYRKMSQKNCLPMLNGDTLKAHIEWLDQRGQKPEFAEQLLRYHYDVTYRESDEDKRIEGELLKAIKGWKAKKIKEVPNLTPDPVG